MSSKTFFPITSKNSVSVKGRMGKVQEASPDLAWAISCQDFFFPRFCRRGGGGAADRNSRPAADKSCCFTLCKKMFNLERLTS